MNRSCDFFFVVVGPPRANKTGGTYNLFFFLNFFFPGGRRSTRKGNSVSFKKGSKHIMARNVGLDKQGKIGRRGKEREGER